MSSQLYVTSTTQNRVYAHPRSAYHNFDSVLKSRVKSLTVSKSVPKMESNITISASFKSENRIKNKTKILLKEKRKKKKEKLLNI